MEEEIKRLRAATQESAASALKQVRYLAVKSTVSGLVLLAAIDHLVDVALHTGHP